MISWLIYKQILDLFLLTTFLAGVFHTWQVICDGRRSAFDENGRYSLSRASRLQIRIVLQLSDLPDNCDKNELDGKWRAYFLPEVKNCSDNFIEIIALKIFINLNIQAQPRVNEAKIVRVTKIEKNEKCY